MILQVRISTTASPDSYVIHVKYREASGETWYCKNYPKSHPLPWCVGQVVVEMGADAMERAAGGWIKQLPPM